MKAITIKQPFASAIMVGLKDVENRTWQTTYRGRIAIHAAKAPAPPEAFDKVRTLTGLDLRPDPMDLKPLIYGVIIGSVELYDIITDSDSEWSIPGQFHWLLRNPRILRRPQPMAGRLGLYEIHLGTITERLLK
jgi:ASCH domain